MVSYRFTFRFSMVVTFILFLSCDNSKKDNTAIFLEELTISQTHTAYKQGDFTAVQLVTAYLNRIDSLDGKINAITFINKDAIDVAKKLDNEFAKTGQLRPLHGIPLIVDSTVASPTLWRPIDDGADIVIHAATKYIGGHGTTIGGVIVDSGKFPWAENAERFPLLNTPDVSYHGVTYTEDFGAAAFIARCRVVPLRNMGAALSAQSGFQLLMGLETLALRMERICENTQKVAEWLENHELVSWVNYAGLPSHKDYALAQKYMKGKASGILSFGLKSGRDGTIKFYDALQLVLRLVNIGDCKSLASIPAETTHRQLNDEELKSAGVTPEMVRLSIGIEHIDDILEDLEQALKASV